MADDNIVTLKTDQQKADEIRAALKEPHATICAIMTQANRDGLKISLNFALDGFGRFSVPNLEITKAL